jgi:hypothetical protein
MRDGLQSLMINQAMAAIAAQYLHQLISVRRITSFETALDLENLTMTSTPSPQRPSPPQAGSPSPRSP